MKLLCFFYAFDYLSLEVNSIKCTLTTAVIRFLEIQSFGQTNL